MEGAERRAASEVLLQTQVHAASRTVLRRAHADAAAIAQLVRAIERVEYGQLGMQLAEALEGEVMGHVQVQLEIGRQRGAVRHRTVLAQPAAEQVVGTDPGAVIQRVVDAAGRGQFLVVIEEDVVVLDVGQILRREVVLAGDDALADGLAERGVEVGRQRALLIIGRQLQSFDAALRIVEGGVDQRRAELAFVLQALHLAIVGVHAQCPGLTDVLRNAEVEIVRAFGQWRVVAIVGYRVGSAVELGDVGTGDHLGGRWREVARIAAVHHRASGRLPDQTQTRTELTLGADQLVAVAAQAVIERPVLADVPFVLHIGGPGLGRQAAVVADVDRRGADLVAVGIGREYPRIVAADGVLEAAVDAVTQRMVAAQRGGEIRLQGAGPIAAGDRRSNPVEHQLADLVRRVVEAAVALAERHLVIGCTELAL